MTQLKFEKIQIPAAGFSRKSNPLPPLSQLKSIPWPVQVSDDISKEDGKYINFGCQTPLLPYMLQDKYDRNRKTTTLSTLILENEYLKATFLPEFGGRLRSLVYKPQDRELLYVNPVIQPANLAYRDAWLSGGVEWNMGMPAHHPFTCEKPFFAVIDNDGCPVLRMYEWERIRNAPFQIDFYLPDESPFLRVRTKLINPHDHEIPGYWFSNIAVPENPNHRVIAPANMAFTFNYSPTRFGVKTAKVPLNEGKDITYPTNHDVANDFFYRLNNDQWPWMTSLDKDGCGLIEASTSKLKGRKLFVWGMSKGGRKWQDFLTEPGNPYVEIQAGFGRTQAECLPLKAQSETEWLEIYGYLQTDGSKVHSDWGQAVTEVEEKLNTMITLDKLQQELEDTKLMSEKHPENIIQYGSGWGALELKLCKKINSKSKIPSGLSFPDDSIDKEQERWLNLLEKGIFPEQKPLDLIESYQTGDKWVKSLESSIESGRCNWTAFYHLGVMYYANNDLEKAMDALTKSCKLEPNHWSYRILANISLNEEDKEKALDYMDKGWQICGNMPEYAEEYATMLVKSEEFNSLDKLLNSLNETTSNRPRIQIAAAKLAFFQKDITLVEQILSKIELVNIRECETTLTDIWFEVQAIKRAESLNSNLNEEIRQYVKQNLNPPDNIDFRMN